MTDEIELLNTMPLRDQRTMVGVSNIAEAHQTPEEVEAAWQAWADEHGLTTRNRLGDHDKTLRRSRKTVTVHISGGKWIADCPKCNGGIAAWPLNPHGCCLDCGTIYNLLYPSREECLELAEIMRVRPERERNYFPHEGETIEDARRTNEVNQYAEQPPNGALSIATLKETLSPKAYRELERAGLV